MAHTGRSDAIDLAPRVVLARCSLLCATMNLRQALHAASVRRVIVLRHGNTHKAEVDADRQLTDKGNRQCDLFREHYADRLSLVHSRRHSRHSHGHHRHRQHR